MRTGGRIRIRGIVQGVGFRPFVYAQALELGISGSVKNLGSEVLVVASGPRFEDFLARISKGPPQARIDDVSVDPLDGPVPAGFSILPSAEGFLSGMIPPDIATCSDCLQDIDIPGGRYHEYGGTSCVNCGPRYSIIKRLPYDREHTSMDVFPVCGGCLAEYSDPRSRRHHAQTIACPSCGPNLTLHDAAGRPVEIADPIAETAALLDSGRIIGIRGIGGFHLSCIEESASELKRRLGRSEQPFAVMVRPDAVEQFATIGPGEQVVLSSQERPIVVLPKKDRNGLSGISNLHTIGIMLPYTGLHHLLFRRLRHPLLVMTSANMPGYPMITRLEEMVTKMHGQVDFFLDHNREIINRCDDSVVRDGFIIRLSRGMAPKRAAVWLGDRCILGIGPELNSNVTVYRDGHAITSPHVGNVRNPRTLSYLQETVERISRLTGSVPEVIAHDLHPQFLSTRYASEQAQDSGAELVAVQHHRAHIAAATRDECIGIAIDGVGYGDDGTVWGGEIFSGQAPEFERVAHLEPVPMIGGDLATRFPERMWYGILPEPGVTEMLQSRGWSDLEVSVLERQLDRGVNVVATTSTGRVLDAAASMLGICRERTYDGEPAMKLESAAINGRPATWDLEFISSGAMSILSTRALMKRAFDELIRHPDATSQQIADIAASFQLNLARGISALAIRSAEERGIGKIALSGGVAYNKAIRSAIAGEVRRAGHTLILNADYPLGDGCISYGQCVIAGLSSQG